jgi:putative ABC transport system permease protein
MERLLQDLRYAFRRLLKNPGFAAIIILTLALGIGATTAIFSVVSGVLLRPLPYPQPERIAQLWQVGAEGNRMAFSDPNFADLHAQSRSFEALAQVGLASLASVSGGSEPARVRTAAVSRDFFAVLGAQPALGRAFLPEEQQDGGSPAVVVSHAFWERYLGADPDLAGRSLTFDGRLHAVVGVMPPDFGYPTETELWTPRELQPVLPSRTAHNWRVVGRLREGVTLAQAHQELSTIAQRLRQQHGDDTWMVDATAVPLHEQIVGGARPALLLLLGASGFLLIIACANLANLLLARAASRQREIAVRLALGAGRRRLARQFLSEALLLSLAGAALGALLAGWGMAVLLALEPGHLPRVGEVRMSWEVLLFAFGLSLHVAMVLGLITAWRSTRHDARSALAEAQRTQAGSVSSQRVRGALIVSQVALTLVLLVGVGLLARSFLQLLAVDLGFRTEQTLAMQLALPYPEDEAGSARLVRFHDEMLARLRTIPGIEQVGGANELPLAGGFYPNGTFLILNRPDEVANFEDFDRLANQPERVGDAQYRVASEGYFRTMDIPLVRGRLFEQRDAPDAPHVAVISESLARARWPGENPIGKLIQFGNMDGDLRAFTIVGIVGDVREQGVATEPQPTLYAHYRQRPLATSRFTYVLHGTAPPGAVIASARRMVHDLDPELPPRFRTLTEIYSGSLADRRFNLLLLGVFGVTALLLAALGIYGVTAYSVARRTQEIGVRVALGAQRSDVVRLVLAQALGLAVAGVGIGLLAGLAITRLMRGLLYGVTPTDPVTLAAVPLFLIVIAVLAAYFPARRATRVDPVIALRSE